eukprot:12282525-Alexandrium_andersonii.AAC.1
MPHLSPPPRHETHTQHRRAEPEPAKTDMPSGISQDFAGPSVQVKGNHTKHSTAKPVHPETNVRTLLGKSHDLKLEADQKLQPTGANLLANFPLVFDQPPHQGTRKVSPDRSARGQRSLTPKEIMLSPLVARWLSNHLTLTQLPQPS